MDTSFDTPRILAGSFVRRVEHFAAMPSTQDRAREAATNPFETLPLLVLADQQLSGRGRDGNTWWTGDGNLAFSLLFDPETFGCPRRAVPAMSLAASVAIVDAVAPRAAGRRVGLHWPNDVFVEGRKLAGVLVEVMPDGRHILGVGLNLNSRAADAPSELQHRLTTLRDISGRTHIATDVLLDILQMMGQCFADLGADAATLGRRFDELCLQRSEILTLYQGERRFTGVCRGVTVDGGLVLETDHGVETFLSGTLQPPKTKPVE